MANQNSQPVELFQAQPDLLKPGKAISYKHAAPTPATALPETPDWNVVEVYDHGCVDRVGSTTFGEAATPSAPNARNDFTAPASSGTVRL